MKLNTLSYHYTNCVLYDFKMPENLLLLLGFGRLLIRIYVCVEFEYIFARVSNNSELKGAHFRILLKKVAIFAKNVRFLYYKEANKKRHMPLKVAPMCAEAHIIRNSDQNNGS